MYTTTTYLFWFSFVVFVLYSIISNYWLGVGKEGLANGRGKDESGSAAISGSKLINFDSTYKIISIERQDNSDKYADVPDKGQAIQFVKKRDIINIINPITDKPFYINNNHITMKVRSIKTNSFPEDSFVAVVSAKCKHCQVTTEWKLFFTLLDGDSNASTASKKTN